MQVLAGNATAAAAKHGPPSWPEFLVPALFRRDRQGQHFDTVILKCIEFFAIGLTTNATHWRLTFMDAPGFGCKLPADVFRVLQKIVEHVLHIGWCQLRRSGYRS